MPAKNKRRQWKSTVQNEVRASLGATAVGVGQTDNNPEEDAPTAVIDTVGNVCHFLGSKGFTEEQIRGFLLTACDLHYSMERDGTEP